METYIYIHLYGRMDIYVVSSFPHARKNCTWYMIHCTDV
jgi:hypothetical protein